MKPGRLFPWALRGAFASALAVVLSPWAATAQPIEWQYRFPAASSGPQIVPDGVGNVYFLQSGRDLPAVLLVKLAPTGTTLWSAPLPSISFLLNTYEQIVAEPANVYLRGTLTFGFGQSCPLVGCTRSEIWHVSPSNGDISSLYSTPAATINAPAGLSDLAAAPGGSAVSTGRLPAGGVIVRAGAAPLQIQFGDTFDRVIALGSGVILATAFDAGAASLRRYDDSGALQWSAAIAAGGCSRLVAAADERVACMTAGGLVVFNANGSLAWGSAVLGDAMAFDASGNLWIAGRVSCTPGLCAALFKLDSSGTVVASDIVVDPARIGEWHALSIGPTGDVYVTGLSRPVTSGTFPPSDMVTARYDNAAVRQWLTTYVGAGNWNDVGSAIVAMSDGAIVAGTVHDTATPSSAVIKYGAAVLAVAEAREVPLIAPPLVVVLSALVGIAGMCAVNARRGSRVP